MIVSFGAYRADFSLAYKHNHNRCVSAKLLYKWVIPMLSQAGEVTHAADAMTISRLRASDMMDIRAENETTQMIIIATGQNPSLTKYKTMMGISSRIAAVTEVRTLAMRSAVLLFQR